MHAHLPCFSVPLLWWAMVASTASADSGQPFSIQAALDAQPGTRIHVPAGDHTITEPIRIRHSHSGLFGEGRIIQTNPDAPILSIEGVQDVEVRDLTFTRPSGREETKREGIIATKCRGLVLSGVRVVNNRTRSAAIAVRESRDTDIIHCRVRNYMRITEDDRTGSKDWGYAFKCIDGTGIAVSYSQGTLISGCRVQEEELLPTREVRQKHDLGRFTRKNPEKGLIVNQKVWDAGYVDNWHQGSGIIVTAPHVSDHTRLLGNHIENAAQGIDLHADHVVVSGNLVENAFIGMKAMHGSRHVIISGNHFCKNDLWSIGLMPGAGSNAASLATPEKAGLPPNVDGGSVIAHNVISDFGRGHAAWVWSGQGTPLRFDERQKPGNPPLKDVVIQGNVIYDSEQDEVGGQDNTPLYEYAVRLAEEVTGLHFSGNLFHPGRRGVSNRPLPE